MTTKVKQPTFDGIPAVKGSKTTAKTFNATQNSAGGVKGLNIGSGWRIGSDVENIIVFRRHITSGGNECLDPVAYFATLAGALSWLVEKEIRGTGLKDFETIVKKVEELKKDILKLYA